MPYETWLKAQAPPWMQDASAQAWLGGIGATLDDYVQQFVAGILAAFPDYAPADALAIIGDELGLDRGPYETDAGYAARLAGAWTAWPYAGGPIGILAALYWAGFTNAVYVQQNGLAYQLAQPLTPGVDPAIGRTVTTLPTNPKNGSPWWSFDNDDAFCSRFAILLPSSSGPFTTSGRAIFNGSDNATVAWNNQNAFSDASYAVYPGLPVVTDNPAVGVSIWNDGVAMTAAGTVIRASDTFTGYVDVLAAPQGANPYAWITDTDRLRLQNAIKKWRGGAKTCVGIYVLVEGNFIGWPIADSTGSATGAPGQLVWIPGA